MRRRLCAQVSGRRSNRILRIGLRSICNLMHRGALDADAKTGDGAGVMTQIPYKILVPEVTRLGHTLYKESDLAVGVMFLPFDNAYMQARAKAITQEVLEKRGLFLFGWREVPINLRVLGEKAQSTMPRIEHVLIGKPWGMADDDYERRLFLARNEIEDIAAADKINNFYIPSFSHRVIVYKGLLVSSSLEKFYPDLSNPDYETSICVYHQRYSTNTFPKWPLAQPFRMLAHNGEINTVRGNRNWMHAREAELKADFWGKDIDLLKPIIQSGGSDSASLDNALEVLTMSGRSILHSMTMLVLPAWRGDKNVPQEVADFYEYHSCLCEPWDGPAALVLHRRHHRLRQPGPERPAPRALQDDRGRHFRPGLGGWLRPPRPAQRRHHGPSRSRRDDRHRHRVRPAPARQGHQAQPRQGPALRRVAA